MDPQLAALRKLLVAMPDCAATRPTKLSNALQQFVSLNEDASRSPNYQNDQPDDLDVLIALIALDAVKANGEVLLRLLKCLRLGGVHVLHADVRLGCGRDATCVGTSAAFLLLYAVGTPAYLWCAAHHPRL